MFNRSGRYVIRQDDVTTDNIHDIINRATQHGYVNPFWIYYRANSVGDMHYELTDGHVRHLAWCIVHSEWLLRGESIEFNWEYSDLLCLL